MFKMIGTLTNAISAIVNALVGITTSIDNTVASANHATSAMRLHASELEADAEHACKLKQDERNAQIAEYQKQLMELDRAEVVN
jgi:hypothetical protein